MTRLLNVCESSIEDGNSPALGNSGIMTVLGPAPERAASSYVAKIRALFSLISCCRSRINFSLASPKPMTIAGGVGEEDPLDDADAGVRGTMGAVRKKKKEEKTKSSSESMSVGERKEEEEEETKNT